MIRGARATAVAVFAASLVCAGPLRAADDPLAPFYGEYAGPALAVHDDEPEAREVRMSLAPSGEGFETTWDVLIHEEAGRVRHRRSTVRFVPTHRPGIFRSAMRRDVFGHQVPLDPLDGEPYLWARLEEDALLIYALTIPDDAGYELQVFERRLVPDGLALRYSRVRDDVPLRSVTGDLARVR